MKHFSQERSIIAHLFFVVALVLSLGFVGCSDDDDDDDATSGILSGTVTSSSTSSALEYATVTAGSETFTTASDGAFSFVLAPGTYTITVSRPGYEGASSENISLEAGDEKTEDFALTALPANTYLGSDQCGVCHAATYATFQKNGHSYKLNKVVNNTIPSYPFSSIEGALEMMADDEQDTEDYDDPGAGTDNPNGTPMSYADISYVIGGFGWKSRWMDKDGYIVTGTSVQYNLETQAMAGYHNNETKVYNCGNCHTTGWKRYDETLNPNHQDGLEGIDGTFALPGVQCESCHGSGSSHAISGSASDITKTATGRTTDDFLASDMAYGKPVACSECHVRDSEKDYPSYEGGPGRIAASGGFIKHHEQYEEMLGINPDDPDYEATGKKASMHCSACHDPHASTIYESVTGTEPGIRTDCIDCHSDKAITSGGMTDLACADCHMPELAKSAVAHDAVGTGPKTGDIQTHIFKIDLTQADQFTADGKYAYPWITGEYACKTCHNGETSFDLSFPSSAKIHN